ncbi:sialic acid-binding Ig-like lectin 14 [Bufo gargarizans]|uniref:sialic acid-binding Ig-like lectin 14 n=1 Tax=Bufo gargarizans TaxID=30331 RepID=UPI001CF4DD33|nr:sialic acid-binding Ig-like lectin 14 [Bufo gargarizans]
MWLSLVVLLPLFWKGITGQIPLYTIEVNSSVSVQEGLCVTIPCKFTADGKSTFTDPFVYWKRSGSNSVVATNNNPDTVQTNFRLTGNPDSGDCTLTLSNTAEGDAGKYYFRFEGNKGNGPRFSYEKTPTTITVTGLTEEPVISDIGTVIAGVNKTLTCAPPGNCSATSLHFQWEKSNVAGIWKNSSTITFTPSTDDDQKTITCQMTNAKGTTTQKNILLHVYSPLTITITWNIPGKKKNKPDPIKVDEGSSMTLTCLVESILPLDVTWTDNKNNILQRGTGKELELKLENIMMTQAGIYTCTAKNEYEKKSANINITVQYSPRNMKITIMSSKGGERPSSQPVVIDPTETLALVCNVDANPNATVVWVKGEVDMQSPKTNNSGSSAMINVTLSTSDVYRCLAWNAIGLIERRIQVGEKPADLGTVTEPTTLGSVLYRDVAIAFICGMSIVLLILLLYKLIQRKTITNKKTYLRTEEPSTSAEPPTDEIYMNVSKPEQKAEEAKDNDMDSSEVTSDQEDLHYSTLAFTAKPIKVASSQPETEYAEIQVK